MPVRFAGSGYEDLSRRSWAFDSKLEVGGFLLLVAWFLSLMLRRNKTILL